jgi:Flp pilus assembly protein TadD
MKRNPAKHIMLLACVMIAGCAELPNLERKPANLELTGCTLRDIVPDDRDRADPEQLKLISEGKAHYRRGQYGLAENNFRKATEETLFGKASGSRLATIEAWYGLAASYDQLRRFDLADPVYEHIKATYGESVPYYNNYGYSLKLRGDTASARAEFEKAMRVAPTCQISRNNLSSVEGG